MLSKIVIILPIKHFKRISEFFINYYKPYFDNNENDAFYERLLIKTIQGEIITN